MLLFDITYGYTNLFLVEGCAIVARAQWPLAPNFCSQATRKS